VLKFINPLLSFYLWQDEARTKKLNEGFEYQEATPELVAKRFKLLFNLHGIQTAEIPEIEGYESITLHDLKVDECLIQKLTPEFLHKTAEKFGIRIEWLRSGEPILYDHRHWYKDGIRNFFEDLKEIDFQAVYDPFFIITTQQKLDVHKREYQPFVLALRKHLTSLGEKDLYRYYIESEWNWHHPPCRLQAKALATQYFKLTGRVVTMYTTDEATLHKIVEGYIPPNDNLVRNHKVSLEEYGALTFPHTEQYEKEEFEAVVNTMKDYEIDKISYEYVSKAQPNNASQAVPKRRPGRKPDDKRREIKDRFLERCARKIYRGETSAAKAARDFFKSLDEDERILLFRSPAEYNEMTYEEAVARAERTLSDHYANQKQTI
jgi:hypothetical protein